MDRSNVLISSVNLTETPGSIKFYDAFYFHLICMSLTSWSSSFPPTNMNMRCFGASELLLGASVGLRASQDSQTVAVLNTARYTSRPA